MHFKIEFNGNTVVFEINSSTAANELLAQLPLKADVKDFGGNEKIFYPPKKLNIDKTPLANAKKGTLAYYAPWGNVVMFYKDFGPATGLYELGNAVSGNEYIKNFAGTIEIVKDGIK